MSLLPRDIRAALDAYAAEHGAVATDALVNDAIQAAATPEIERIAERLQDIDKVGPVTALEIVAAVGRRMNGNGKDLR